MALSRDSFRQHARPIEVKIGDRTFLADVKEFSTGSLGWNLTAKEHYAVNGDTVKVQIGLNMTVVGSKELPPQ